MLAKSARRCRADCSPGRQAFQAQIVPCHAIDGARSHGHYFTRDAAALHLRARRVSHVVSCQRAHRQVGDVTSTATYAHAHRSSSTHTPCTSPSSSRLPRKSTHGLQRRTPAPAGQDSILRRALGGGKRLARLLGLLLFPLALSYFLDHKFLCRVDNTPSVDVDDLVSKKVGLHGVSMRGKVAVVLDGHRGLGYQVSR